MDRQLDMAGIARNQQDPDPHCGRRSSPSRPRPVRFLAVLALAAGASTAGFGDDTSIKAAEADDAWHPIDSIAKAAEQFVLDQAGTTVSALSPQAGHIDARLKLAKCREPLATSLQSGSALTGRATVQVECEGGRPWKIFVPVQILVTDTVVVAARSLASGHVLTMDDVLFEERDVTRLRNGYVAQPEEIVGKGLKRQLLSGRVITPSMLVEQAMIKRGQSVTITADFGGLSIETAGKALMDGAMNERIEVENDGSKQVIEAVVRSPEHVEVLVN